MIMIISGSDHESIRDLGRRHSDPAPAGPDRHLHFQVCTCAAAAAAARLSSSRCSTAAAAADPLEALSLGGSRSQILVALLL